MKKIKLIIALLACGFTMQSQAASVGTTFAVTANILGNCTVVAEDLNFGNVDLNLGARSSSVIRVNCPALVPAMVKIDGGLNYNGSRQVNQVIGNDTELVSYQLFMDQSETDPFLVTTTEPFGGVSIIGTGVEQVIDVFGVIPIQSSKPAGLYRDLLNVTVNY